MMRLMQYLHTLGLHVLRDIAVVGFDDLNGQITSIQD
jgi:DNA-binding LacI/PurR family transcriptional regulator